VSGAVLRDKVQALNAYWGALWNARCYWLTMKKP
jgi:hypothetical protein